MNIKVGQPVKVKEVPDVCVVIGWADTDPNKVYLIKYEDINTHSMTKVIESSINEIAPLKMYDVNEGDIIEVGSKRAKVVNASAKDIGVVDVTFHKDPNTYSISLGSYMQGTVASPLNIKLCAHCGFVVTASEESNCPLKNKPITKIEPKQKIDLKASLLKILNSLDINTFDIKQTPKKIEKNEDFIINTESSIDIGEKVRRLGSPYEGVVLANKRGIYTVAWANGTKEICWKQEIVPLIHYQEI